MSTSGATVVLPAYIGSVIGSPWGEIETREWRLVSIL
jgi:hypothetical protein